MKSSTKASRALCLAAMLSALSLAIPGLAQAQTGESFQLYISNERSADVTVINAADLQPGRETFEVALLLVGKVDWESFYFHRA